MSAYADRGSIVRHLVPPPAEPMPLVAPEEMGAPYPVAELGPVLADATNAIIDATQVAPEIAAQSVLAAAALAAQAHADVETPARQIRPLSCFFVTVAESGERKSAADHWALAPVREDERRAREIFAVAYRSWRNANDAWEAQRSAIKGNRKMSLSARENALEELGSQPRPPLSPELIAADVTAEGLVKTWVDGRPSRGLFTAEGALFSSGHAMSDEARMRTAATFSGLWDAGTADRVRGGDGHTRLFGRRLSAHIMIQPQASRALLAASDLADQGLTARMLVAAPASRAGQRKFRLPPENDGRLSAYNSLLGEMLATPPLTSDNRNELSPRLLRFSKEAAKAWIEFHDHVEARLGRGGELAPIKALGSKLAEHVARLAGVLSLAADPDTVEVGLKALDRATALGDYYAREALRLAGIPQVSDGLTRAERLREWIVGAWEGDTISGPDMQRLGPRSTREKAKLDAAVELLVDHGWLIDVGSAEVDGTRRRRAWRVVRPSP